MAVVRTRHIRIHAPAIPKQLIAFLRSEYGEVEILRDEELVDVTSMDWYKKADAATTPGDNLRAYRQLHHMTQEQLGEKLGRFSKQNVSNMEAGRRGISKDTAKKLGLIFKVDPSRFL